MAEHPFPGVEIHHRGSHYAALDAGAHVIEWTPPEENPVLWLSPLETFTPGKAVRGGVPVVFPWFGAGATGVRKPAHGFARTSLWRRSKTVNDRGGRVTVHYNLDDHAFAAQVTASFSPENLEVSLRVTNPGEDPFTYEEALHTYLAVSGIDQIEIDGLAGCRYLDKADGARPGEIIQNGPIRFDGEFDRIYHHTTDAVVTDPGWARAIHIDKQGSANTVIWNPGPAKGTALADVGPNWPAFVCVEAGNLRDAAITLEPGESHILTQRIRLG